MTYLLWCQTRLHSRTNAFLFVHGGYVEQGIKGDTACSKISITVICELQYADDNAVSADRTTTVLWTLTFPFCCMAARQEASQEVL